MTNRYEVTVTVKQSGIDTEADAVTANNKIARIIEHVLINAGLWTGDTVLGAHIESYDPGQETNPLACQVKHRDGRVCGEPYENHRCFPNG